MTDVWLPRHGALDTEVFPVLPALWCCFLIDVDTPSILDHRHGQLRE
jgi:hypothetical protein